VKGYIKFENTTTSVRWLFDENEEIEANGAKARKKT